MKTFRDNPYYKYLTPETKEHARLIEWLSWIKPGLYIHYPAEGKKTPFERFLWAIMGGKKSVPDFLFFDARGGWNGLAIELKTTGTVVMKQDGTLRKEMIPQWLFLQELQKRGWRAMFCVGFDEAQKVIKDYYGIV